MKPKGHISRIVFSLLRDDNETRDDWMLMIRRVHDIEMKYHSITKSEYYDSFYANKFSNVDSIKRLWAFFQEHNPALRGEKWKERQRQGGEIASIISNNQLNLF